MLNFESDYTEGAHPKILQRFLDTNLIQTSGYGADPFTESAVRKIRSECACPDADIFLLTGGTQTNSVVIDSLLRSYEGVVAVDTGHIAVHEAGAIESCGHKVLTLPGTEGKLDAASLQRFLLLCSEDENRDHMVFPGMVYISHPTEYGTLYSAQELKDLSRVCRDFGLPLFLDGARLGYGLMSLHTDVTLPMIAEYTDVFYIGGTKVGALCGEAVVFPRRSMPRHFFTTVKQHGALLAKGRLLGIQFDTLFTDGLYYEISRNAIETAELLKTEFRNRGYRFLLDSPTNQQFVILENRELEALKGAARFSFWEAVDETHCAVRFATSWATTMENVRELFRAIDRIR